MSSCILNKNLSRIEFISYRNVHYLRSRLFVPNKPIKVNEKLNKESENSNKSLSVSNSILVSNGFITDSGSGLFINLPLAKRVVNKLSNVIRNEMNKIGGQEIEMPALSDLNLWKQSNREELMGSELFRLTDRHKKQLCLCPTHEEIVTNLVSKFSKSIPSSVLGDDQSLRLYQITRKYRDESRPKHGLLRSREFLMKDMYSFHKSDSCADKTYNEVCKAYENTFEILNLNYKKALASVGNMGGKKSHEYHVISSIGEDKIFTCSNCSNSISSDLIEASKENKTIKCNSCGTENKHELANSIEIGHTFILGDRYTKVFPVQLGKDSEVIMGCYGIGVSRVVQAVIESNHIDKKFPNLPLEIAPFQIAILPAKQGSKEEEKSKRMVGYLCDMFESNPLFRDDVIVDDRDSMSIGSRIIETKLIGVPYAIALGKTIHDEEVEIVITSKDIAEAIGKPSVICHSRETAHVLKQLNNDYLYMKGQKK